MLRKIFLLFAVCTVILPFSPILQAQSNYLRVDESATRFFLREKTAEVSLIAETHSASADYKTNARVRIELATPNDEVKAVAERDFEFQNGINKIDLALANFAEIPKENFAFYRLRYQINSKTQNIGGIIAVSEIAPEMFEIEASSIEASSSEYLRENLRYLVRTRAVQAINLRGVSDVKMSGEIKIEFDDKREPQIVRAESLTDTDGYALLQFSLPNALNLVDDAQLKITGSKNNLEREAETDDIRFFGWQSAYLQTDKPLYQPGQMLRVRTLLLSSSNHAIPNAEVTFKIQDPEETMLQQIAVKTSRFGVASIEWPIPENSKLGDYRVVVETKGNNLERDMTSFKVSRYDLPNFVVNAKPDKSFYLPDEKSAAVEVSANYLFGKAVAKGRVRVVQENKREWNYELQKYETDEGASAEGELNEQGKFVAHFDLTKEHADFEDSRYRKFVDVHFAAYVTDLTTNRTEQRRFDVRLTKEAIHAYLIGETYNISRRLSPKFYVSTFYADGTPASCDVTIRQNRESNQNEKPIPGKVLLKSRTSRTGAAKITVPLTFLGEDEDDFDFVITARDKNGRNGATTGDFNFDDNPAVQVTTDKTIYRAGDSVKVEIRSSESNGMLFVDVVRNGETIRAERVTTKNGRVILRLPYRDDFKNALTIAAYGEYKDKAGDDEIFSGTKTIIFPHKSGLQIVAETKTEYHPGEDASVNFVAARADGKLEETALGVVILDKAIEERARANADFGSRYQDFCSGFSNLLGLNVGFGGLTRNNLDNLDLRRKPSTDLNLAAEISLRNDIYPKFFRSREFRRELIAAFAPVFDKQFEPIKNALNKRFKEHGESPASENDLRRILDLAEIDFAALRDPWNGSYRVSFETKKGVRKLKIESAGADKKFETNDDLTASTQDFEYFRPIGEKLTLAVAKYHQRIGGFVRDYATLQTEAKRENVDLNNLRDVFGNPYHVKFGISQSNFVITVQSGGPNGKLDSEVNDRQNDDFTVWTNSADYFTVTRANMTKAVGDYLREKQMFPPNENELKLVLKTLGFDLDALRDVFNNPYYLSRKQIARYADKLTIVKNYGKTNSAIKPITQQIITYAVKSAGEDGRPNNNDDFELATFTGVVAEQTKNNSIGKAATNQIVTTSITGAISGTITDPNGAIIPAVKVSAVQQNAANVSFEEISNEDGYFLLQNLPAGTYELTFDAQSFKRAVVQSVPVQTENVTEVNVSLEVGGTTEVVTVTSDAAVTETASASMASTVTVRQINELPINGRKFESLVKLKPGTAKGVNKNAESEQQIETPRLRKYFPETLVWQPELVTDANGKASLNFKLADSLTTWKMAVVGSTVDGEIGVAEKEFKTFQPFFAEHDPPKILTAGDRIALPVVLRNYLDKPQKVSATMKEESWFKLSGSASQTLEVAPNSAQNAIFNFEAVAAVKDGKQRVTAIGTDSSDAIEKPVTVHPNGREVAVTESRIFREAAAFEVNFPADALPNTQKAELKIYPNLMSHVVEAIEGILHRPYGCGEQTISSTYPSLLILKAAKNGADSELKSRARKYLQIGYDRLLGYKAADGGFNYWGRGAADVPLSAYALRFLLDAREFVAVDEDLIKETGDFLVKEQTADGSWRDSAVITAYTARILAMTARDEKSKAALQKALKFLQTESAKIDEPYVLAQNALALFDAGETDAALKIAEKLKTLAKTEGDGIYWKLETNTPFYGWGIAGRTETTALVLQVLAKAEKITHNDAKAQGDNQISQGLQFLLKNKDRYGVWYSTQTTINVLDTLIALLPKGESAEQQTAAEIFVNGQKARGLLLSNKLNNPTTLDLSELLTQTVNRVEIRQNGAASPASAQVVQNYYVAWNQENGFRANDANGLRLKVDYDKTNTAISDEITCRVDVERVGFKGYGMLIAEIGLPPGADVSRESLEKAVADSGWNLSSYDILPDKLIVYLWAKPGGSKFEFRFKPRYGIEASTAPSLAYDYYNPESNAVLAPTRFSVK